MTRETRQRLARLLAVCCAAIPIGFGTLRALTTRTDFRYLFMALAALAATGITVWAGASRVRPRRMLAFLALAVSTLVGGVVAVGEGATSAVAVGVVALGFGLCATASGMLALFSRSAD